MLGEPFLTLRTARGVLEVDLVPTQVDQFRCSQAVPVGHKDHRRVAVAVPVALGCFRQAGDLRISQVFAGAELGILRASRRNCSFSVVGVTNRRLDFAMAFNLPCISTVRNNEQCAMRGLTILETRWSNDLDHVEPPWEIAENLHRADLSKLERDEQIEEWIKSRRIYHTLRLSLRSDEAWWPSRADVEAAAREIGMDDGDTSSPNRKTANSAIEPGTRFVNCGTVRIARVARLAVEMSFS